jgi:hypothetical protein
VADRLRARMGLTAAEEARIGALGKKAVNGIKS